MNNSLIKHRQDNLLLLTVLGMTLFGLVMIYSASVIVGHQMFNDGSYFVKKQIISFIIGSIAMIVASSIDYRTWQKYTGVMLIVTFALLISVFIFSKGEINGAHRWINIGPIKSVQPSEFAKLTLIIYLSGWLANKAHEMKNLKEVYFPFMVVMTLVSVLMMKEPDFGTLIVILAASACIYFMAGMNWKQMIITFIIGVLALGAIAVSSPYRRDRVLTFLGAHKTTGQADNSDQVNKDYHVYNIGVAVGSGGAFGLGFGESKQKRGFLPEPQTDSIFAVITEELGSFRSVWIMILFGVLAWRGFRIVKYVPDRFGQLLATGITAWFIFQAFINLGSMLQLVPLVGVPLPFISYGGTNLIISLVAVGLLLNISKFTTARQKGK